MSISINKLTAIRLDEFGGASATYVSEYKNDKGYWFCLKCWNPASKHSCHSQSWSDKTFIFGPQQQSETFMYPFKAQDQQKKVLSVLLSDEVKSEIFRK